ncbi:hypothetical protein P152DRAFT_462261 [Eremomyces bilateralis CBS 781.70]|uniref:Uncharacterized protein n=1 Tax=Eremomyces bilateralis CBS 781.70 TaxID=1392243 RepID=A0A6G1FSI3_9PEZI|nr:uncharacterized protein P152DRAFT_462261 [Eremomyces bilateralis CBS 781.70]KAF1808696.1 hypothetical protein P152DRAFT_462261 [Eremomyces bilateralis CBS 781.70]
MAANGAQPSIWVSMNYVPPRGSCQHKSGMMASKCPCMRFMIHPLKVATSFECDGCNHHASFHSMENKEEDEIVKRWRVQEADEASQATGNKRKRPRNQIEFQSASGALNDKMDLGGDTQVREFVPAPSTRRTRGKAAKRTAPVPGSGDAGYKVYEILDEE